MSNIAHKRVARELHDMSQNLELLEAGFLLELVGDDMTKLVGTLPGPPDSPYAGGKYRVEITIPTDYPFSPPKVRFTTRLWHPNVSSVTGTICLDLLQTNWPNAMTMESLLLSLQMLLGIPMPDDPLDYVVARQDKEVYLRTARHWAGVYAGSGSREPEYEQLVRQVLRARGVNEDKARHTLSCCDWDLQVALARVSELEVPVQRLQAQGVEEAVARRTLSEVIWDLLAALQG